MTLDGVFQNQLPSNHMLQMRIMFQVSSVELMDAKGHIHRTQTKLTCTPHSQGKP
jgi:hypothetical protein